MSNKVKYPPCVYKRQSQGYSSVHQAIDFAGDTGSAIYAAMDGTVTHTGWNYVNTGASTYGIYIDLHHGGQVYTRYAHLSKVLVSNGQKVTAGTKIGLMGNTGNSTGPHLHFEVHTKGVWGRPFVNPATYFAGKPQVNVTDTIGSIAGLAGLAAGVVDTNLAYEMAVRGGILPPREDFTPYAITLTRNSPDVNYTRLKQADVCAVLLEGGYYYNSSHVVMDYYKNPKLDKQVEAAVAANIPYGLYVEVRAKNVAEAKKEVKELALVVRRHSPQIGLWLKPYFSASKSNNDKIIDYYYDYCVEKLGLKDQLGIYGTKSQLNTISWDKYYDKFYLWLIDKLSSFQQLNELLTPTFFMLD